MGWAGVSEGLKHWDTKAIGGAINQVYANHVEETAKEAAKKKYDEQVAALQKEYAAGQEAQKAANSTPQPRALSTQADGPATVDTGVDAVSAPQQAAIKPMTQAQYESRLREAENAYKNDQSQARIDYYKARGMDEERFKAEDELKNSKFHQGMVKKYYDVVNGDPTATKELVNYMNASMGGGNQIAMNDDGTMSLLQNGKVVQANFTPSRQQINDAFGSMYTMAKFVNDGNFDSMLDRSSKMQGMAIAARGDDRAERRLNLDTLIADRNFQAKMKELGLDEARLRQTFDLFQQEQDRLDARQATQIAATAAENEKNRALTASEGKADRENRTEINNATIAAADARQEKEIQSKKDLQKDAQTHELKVTGMKLDMEKAIADATNALKERGVKVDEAKVALDYQKYADKVAAENADKSVPYTVDDYNENVGFVGRRKDASGKGTGDVLFYQAGPDQPRIPAGMTAEQYAANAEMAKRLGVDYGSFYDDKSDRFVAAYKLPNGDVVESFEEAKTIMKSLGKAIPEPKNTTLARPAIPEPYAADR